MWCIFSVNVNALLCVLCLLVVCHVYGLFCVHVLFYSFECVIALFVVLAVLFGGFVCVYRFQWLFTFLCVALPFLCYVRGCCIFVFGVFVSVDVLFCVLCLCVFVLFLVMAFALYMIVVFVFVCCAFVVCVLFCVFLYFA